MGHANYARQFRKRRQPDILCASISVLIITTVNALKDLGNEQLTVRENEKTGFIHCDIQGNLQEKSAFLIDAMVFGLEKLSMTYGSKYLQVEYEEV